MKTSSRNVYSGTITAIITGGLNDEVELQLASGEKVYGQLSHASAERLGLAVGGEAVALVKATEILLVNDNDDYDVCCRNQFTGKVLKLVRGFVNGEVIIQTPSGLELNATVTLEGINRLRVERGAPVTAMFKSSNVMIAIKK
ncbi:MAG: TOBE domain-containing protein [Mailhella sp.]|nr:TOBE domain-containing protein [Mailhella sp.]MBQ9104512.1 TOBE domain-containing protein [Mailhella sp.]